LKKGAGHVGEAYALGVLVPKDNGAWTGPWDCAEFLSWCVFQVTGSLYGCHDNHADPASADAFTGYWERDAAIIGRSVSVASSMSFTASASLNPPLNSAAAIESGLKWRFSIPGLGIFSGVRGGIRADDPGRFRFARVIVEAGGGSW